MSTSHLRLMAVGLSLIVAVLTGVLTGLVGARQTCAATPPERPLPEPTASAPTAPASPTRTGENRPFDGSVDGEVGRRGVGPGVQPNSGPGGPLPPAVPQSQTGPSSGTTREFAPGGGGGVDLAAPSGCTDSFSVPAAAVGFGGAALAGLVTIGVALLASGELGRVAVRSGRPAVGDPGHLGYGRSRGAAAPSTATGTAAPGIAAPSPAAVGVVPSPDRQTEADRGVLVATCIYVRDRATSRAISDRLARALDEVGVTELRPEGVSFDPAHHEAGGTVPAGDSSLEGTVAAVELVGYTDRGGEVLRLPVVTVYRAGRR